MPTTKPMTGAERALQCIQDYSLDAARRTLRERQRDGGATRPTRKLIARLEARIAEREKRAAAVPVEAPPVRPGAPVLEVF